MCKNKKNISSKQTIFRWRSLLSGLDRYIHIQFTSPRTCATMPQSIPPQFCFTVYDWRMAGHQLLHVRNCTFAAFTTVSYIRKDMQYPLNINKPGWWSQINLCSSNSRKRAFQVTSRSNSKWHWDFWLRFNGTWNHESDLLPSSPTRSERACAWTGANPQSSSGVRGSWGKTWRYSTIPWVPWLLSL